MSASTQRQETIQEVHRTIVQDVFSRQQREILDAVFTHRRSAILGARQVIGKTAAMSYAALCISNGIDWRSGRRVHRIPPHDVHLVSKSERHSQDVVRRIKKLLGAFDVGVSEGRKQDSLTDPELGSMSRIALANGTFIYAHSSSTDSVQGFPGSVIVEEIGAARDPESLYAQAASATARHDHYRIALIGNASARGDWWHSLWESEEEKWIEQRATFALARHTVEDVYPDGLPQRLEEMRLSMGERAWRKWFLCEFLDAYDRAIAAELIEIANAGAARTEAGAPVVLGIDPGGHFNPTGYCVARVGGFGCDVLQSGYWYGPTGARPESDDEAWVATQMQRVEELVRTFRPMRIVVDHSNMSPALGHALAQRYGSMVELRPTTNDTQQKRWGTLSALFADCRISLPADADDLRADLARLELDGSAKGRVNEMGRLVLPVKPAGKYLLHCDIAAALLLCCEHVHELPAVSVPSIDLTRSQEGAVPIDMGVGVFSRR